MDKSNYGEMKIPNNKIFIIIDIVLENSIFNKINKNNKKYLLYYLIIF